MSTPRKRSRGLRRGLGLAALLLLVGFVTTLATAWGSALCVKTPDTFKSIRGEGLSKREWWVVGKSSMFGGRRYFSRVMIRANEYKERPAEAKLPGWAELPTPIAGTPMRPAKHYEILDARGWPWPTLTSRFSGTGEGNRNTGVSSGGIALEPWKKGAWYDPCVLPCTPIWGNLIASIVFWAMVWGAVFMGPAALRRAFRARRGGCLACGYDIRGMEGGPAGQGRRCPECGTTFLRRLLARLGTVLTFPMARDVHGGC